MLDGRESAGESVKATLDAIAAGDSNVVLGAADTVTVTVAVND
ncbi:MAG: hypothetical protein ACFB4I_11525 [Cyanophyceae cyanobacterium]